MRCPQVRSLLDRYIDGRLAPSLADEIAAHLEYCWRCTRELADARKVLAGLVSSPIVRAPAGFRQRVMAEVYRQSLPGQQSLARGARQDSRRGAFYRRLGLAFVSSAAILTASLAVPRVSYPSILASRAVETDLSAGSASIVRMSLIGADRVVREALGSRTP